MDKPPQAAPGKLSAATDSPLTSHTVNFGTDGETNFDQTIKVKVPGTGMTVFNRYKLQRVLGRGGMGIVWLADDLKLERPVALKFLPSLIGLDPAAVKELKTETRRGLELSHPNIVRIYDFVDDDDAAAISMEFVDGKTLSELRSMTEHGIFTVEDISKWLPGVCDALDYAHFQRKVVHRDLKPANIMLTGKDDVAKVADFGIARSLSDTMSRLSAAHIGTSGTLPYMSPQQAMGERPLPTDDVYSLGATIYELLAGKPPFYRGDLPTQINSKIPPPMGDRRRELELSPKDNIPKQWEEAIAACLNKDPNLRPSCAGMLMEMLGLRAMSSTSRTLTFAPGTSLARGAKPKSKAPLAAVAVVAFAAVAGGVWYATQRNDQPSSTPVAANIPTPPPAPEASEPKDKKASAKSESSEPPVVAAKTEPKAPPPEVAATPAPSTPAETPAPAAPPPVATAATTNPAPVPPATTPAAPAATAGSTPLVAANNTAVPAADPSTPGTAPMTVIPGSPPAVASLPPALTTAPTLPPSAPPAVQPTVPFGLDPQAAAMPAQPTLPPGVIAPGYSPPMPAQPLVSDPPAGFWTLDQIYPSPPFATYSAPGRKYLLYRTQAVLKEKGLYTSAVDGREGKSTHNAIQLFQAKSGLKPTGLLDMPTLAALQLAAEPDNMDWMSPAAIPIPPGRRAAGGARYSRPQEADDPNFLERTSDRLKGIFR
jgi:serine/threonine protein kinase